jgi:hypothetical protein
MTRYSGRSGWITITLGVHDLATARSAHRLIPTARYPDTFHIVRELTQGRSGYEPDDDYLTRTCVGQIILHNRNLVVISNLQNMLKEPGEDDHLD